MSPLHPLSRHRDAPIHPSQRRRPQRSLTFAQWLDANVKYLFLALTAIAVLTIAFYALNVSTPKTSTAPAGGPGSSEAPLGAPLLSLH